MSLDTAPCGCLVHADNEDLCRYPELRRDLDAQRSRAAALAIENFELKKVVAALRFDAGTSQWVMTAASAEVAGVNVRLLKWPARAEGCRR